MTRGQRLALYLVAAAAFLLLGRGFALLYADRAWYEALGAISVWRTKVGLETLIYVSALAIGTSFVFLNLTMVRRSIVALILPARIGNVEIGEEIPSSRLAVLAGGMSVFVAMISMFIVPNWTTLARWQSNVWFNESDPYFGLDIGYYVAWFPLESQIYAWSFVVFTIVVLLVVTLYGLTPSLSWERGRVKATTHARRHITILGAILVLFTAWGFRLDAYSLLIEGSGSGGLFTHFDHEWLVTVDLVLSLLLVGASIALLASGWVGQTQLAFGIVTAVIIACLVAKVILPWVSNRRATNSSAINLDFAYVATQRLYTEHAFPFEPLPPSTRFAADSALLTSAPRVRQRHTPDLPDLVYPGARGVAIELDPERLMRAPRVGGFFSRLLNAWAEQDARILGDDFSPSEAFIRRRDLRDRVAAIAPVFAQSHAIGARSTSSIGVVWIIDLYSTSESYPLGAMRQVGNDVIKYRHHAATAYVSGTTGNVTVVRDSILDPIADAWFKAHPGRYVAATVPFEMMSANVPNRFQIPITTRSPDSAFRAKVSTIYLRMRSALDSGNFRAFGDAFDSLKTAVGAR